MDRPVFPKRAVVTAGMPYGNKQLHFGHVGGMFVHADFFAAFLRDRIGAQNVIFVSGTDCYGSPIAERYRVLCEQEGYTGTIEDFVRQNHEHQKKTLEAYEIKLNLFAASALGQSADIHRQYSAQIFEDLYAQGVLKKLSSPQFYDQSLEVFLNGRQVVGRCPISGCKSEEAYADECSLGHQYLPEHLIAPVSKLSGCTPQLVDAQNWYFDLPAYTQLLQKYIDSMEGNGMREHAATAAREFLKPPILHLKSEDAHKLSDIPALGEYELEIDEKRKTAKLEFANLPMREQACKILAQHGIRFRTGKTLVPFRLSGNIEWGVPVPCKEDVSGLTFWVWPESLWAPISFCKTYLSMQGASEHEWENWWKSPDCTVYQFIGEDNIYFYGLAQQAMFMALNGAKDTEQRKGDLALTTIVANKHILFFDKKASSSGKIRPPMAHELLDYYTAEQLRAHFLGLGLGMANVPFQPKPLNPQANPNQGDPVLKEGSLFTNVLNRALRTLFYTLQKYTDSVVPQLEPAPEILQEAEQVVKSYELLAYKHEFHNILNVLDDYIRKINREFSAEMKQAQQDMDAGVDGAQAQIERILVNALHRIKTAVVLSHPICPQSCKMVQEYMNIDDRLWSWDYIMQPLNVLMQKDCHRFEFLQPKTDFFCKHASQLG